MNPETGLSKDKPTLDNDRIRTLLSSRGYGDGMISEALIQAQMAGWKTSSLEQAINSMEPGDCLEEVILGTAHVVSAMPTVVRDPIAVLDELSGHDPQLADSMRKLFDEPRESDGKGYPYSVE